MSESNNPPPVTDSIRRRQPPTYAIDGGCLCRLSYDDIGQGKDKTTIPVLQPITNFEAKIVEEHHHFAASGDSIEYLLSTGADDSKKFFTLRPEEFSSTSWPMRHLGADAVVYDGPMAADRLRTAIQTVSNDIRIKASVDALGWAIVNDRVAFLSHGNPILGQRVIACREFADSDHIATPDRIKGIYPMRTLRPVNLPEVSLVDVNYEASGPLSLFHFPALAMGKDLQTAIRSALEVRDLGPAHLIAPLLAATFSAPLAEQSSPIFLHGPTKTGKSELAAIMQSFFGSGFERRNLPGNFSSTANARELQLHLAGDVLLVVDDYVPWSSDNDPTKLQRDAARLIRSVGNGASRLRCSGSNTLLDSHPPRCVVLCTGEALPSGASIENRMFAIPVTKECINWDVLTAMQHKAKTGVLVTMMRGYVQWLASHFAHFQEFNKLQKLAHRDELIGEGLDSRIADSTASLLATSTMIVSFARDFGDISDDERNAIHDWLTSGIRAAAYRYSGSLHDLHPADQFIHYLQHMLHAGLCHIEERFGGKPESDPALLGWRQVRKYLPSTGEDQEPDYELTWQASGPRIGWIHGDVIYLSGPMVLKQLRSFLPMTHELQVSESNLGRVLFDRGLIDHRELGRDGYRCRPRIDGGQKSCYAIKAAPLLSSSIPQQRGWTQQQDYDDVISAGSCLDA